MDDRQAIGAAASRPLPARASTARAPARRGARRSLGPRALAAFKILFASLLSVAVLFPLYAMVTSSLKLNADVFDLRLIPKVLSTSGYAFVFKEDFSRYFLNSLFIAATVTVVALAFHAMSGYALARLDFAGKRLIFLWILSTLMVPFAVIMIPLFILVKSLGLLNSYAGVIMPAIPHAFGIFLFRQFFLTMPKDLGDAATIDGCSMFQTFSRIFLPLSKPVAMMLAVSFFIANWNNYLWPLVVNQQKRLWVLQVAVASFVGRNNTPWNAILAAGVITVLPSVLIFFVLQKSLVEGIKMSGIK
jgi:multiple sugar transport system permease protein